ncbi:hypothetical protein BH20ACI4_BH20ACI4_23690 [soil metagenome]
MKTNLKTFFKRLYQKALFEEDILSTAAQVAFYFSFALFPLLLFLVSLFGIILESADEFRSELFYYLRQIMPYTAYELVQNTIKEVTANSSGGKLTIGLLIALWSASAGVDSLRIALNSVYSLEEKRSWIKTKLISLFSTFSLTVLITIACGIVFYGGKFISLILSTINFSIPSPFVLMIFQWVIVLVVLLVIYGLIYNFLPMHEPYKWVWISPGAITGIVLWLTLSYAFRTYLSFFNTYDKTYGSLGAVIILMLWLYLTALVILIGGIINATLQEMTDPETAAKSEEQSEIKLERAKAERAPEEIEKIKEENKETQKEISDNQEPEQSISAPAVAAPEKPEQSKKVIQIENGSPELPEKQVSKIEKPNNKTIVGLTVAGAFGFLMGLIFRKKGE